MEIKCNLNEMWSWDKRPYIVVVDRSNGRVMKSYGDICGSGCNGNGTECSVTLVFKTADNESQVKMVKASTDGSWSIESMMRNRPVPVCFEVVEVGVVERYSSEEREKREIMGSIHKKLSSRCNEYVHYDKPVSLDLESVGRTVDMEYFTKDWFGIDDIINYQTDHVCMSRLSLSDLKKVYAAM